MEENQHQLKIYGFMQSFIYGWTFLDIYIHCFSYIYDTNKFIGPLNLKLYDLPWIFNPNYSHIVSAVAILLVSLAAKAKKDIKFNVWKKFFIPFGIGLILFLGSIYILNNVFDLKARTILYISTLLIGTLLLHTSLSNLTKIIFTKLKDDVWNVEEESFDQNRVKSNDPAIFSLPMQFYYKKKVHNGYLNLNPYRGAFVIGVPGSGKTESVIIPFIKEKMAQGNGMLIYDFKFPALAKIVYYHYLLNKNNKLKNHQFHCINLEDIEHSRRINPIDAKYLKTISDASETADGMVTALTKSDNESGAAQFFKQSAVNFLAAVIYFFKIYKNGIYSDLPHVLAFLQLKYDEIFTTLYSEIELVSLLSPFKTAYDNKAFDQLEGQIGTLKINLSRLATKEAFWVFGKNDFDLKFSNPASIVVLANSANGQNINSAFFSSILLRMTKLVNTPGNNYCNIIVDECPTVYLHKVDNLIATARSNKVGVMLGAQELTQFQQQYGKETAKTIISLMGSVLSGAVRDKETLDWLEKLFGKIKQVSTGLNVDRNKVSVNQNERMESVIPANKIANQNSGEISAIVSRENQSKFEEFKTNTFKCKVKLDLEAIEKEKEQYKDLPKVYDFGTESEKNEFLLENMKRIIQEVQAVADEYMLVNMD